MNGLRSAIVAVALSTFSAFALSQSVADLPQPKTAGGIMYLSGGIGKDEQDAMKSVAKNYDLQITFAEQGSGAYETDVRVAIDNARGTRVFEATSDGPMMLLHLPAGRYSVSGLVGDRLVVRKVTVTGRSLVHATMLWPGVSSEE